MAYEATTQDLIEECQHWLEMDHRFFDASEGCFTWWGRVVTFHKNDDDITLEYDGESVSFPRI